MTIRRERCRPSYDLAEAKALVAQGRYRIARRARDFIANRYGMFDPGAIVSELFGSLAPSEFYKSESLDRLPGTWGDIYRHVPYDGEEWYVKFFLDGEGRAVVVLSSNWEGYIH